MKAGPLHVSEGVDAGCGGLQDLVRLDKVAFVASMLAASRLRVSVLGGGPAATRRYVPSSVRSPSDVATVRMIFPVSSCAARVVWVPIEPSIPTRAVVCKSPMIP